MLRYHFTFFGINHHVDRTETTACKLKAIYFGEVDRFELTRSTLANFKFQCLAKVKIDQVNKKQIFSLTTSKNSKARCCRNWRCPNV